MAEMTTKEFWARTGITEGYGAEILKDAEHAAWHIPQGAKWADEAAEEPDTDEPVVDDPVVDNPNTDEPNVDDPTDDTGAGEGTDAEGGADLDEDNQEPVTDAEGGSVEGEPEE